MLAANECYNANRSSHWIRDVVVLMDSADFLGAVSQVVIADGMAGASMVRSTSI